MRMVMIVQEIIGYLFNMEKIKIEYNKTEILKIVQVIVKDHNWSDEIAECIIEELNKTEVGFKNFLLATQGVRMRISDFGFEINQKAITEINNLSTWRMNKPEMEKRQLILNNTVEIQIVAFDRTIARPIQVMYKIINDDNKEKIENDWISPTVIKLSIL